jgi:sirohydrochlorin cobaltochelatase
MEMLVVIGYNAQEWANLTHVLSQRLGIPVQSAFLDGSPSVGESIQIGITQYRPQHVVVLPLFISASSARKNNVHLIVEAAQDRWPDVWIHYGSAPGTHPGVISAYKQLIDSKEDTALLVIGRGSRDAESGTELQQIAPLLWDGIVETAFVGAVKPAVERLAQSGIKRVIALPYVLYEADLSRFIHAEIEQIHISGIEITLTAPLSIDNEDIMQAISDRYHEALSELKRSGLTPRLHIHNHSHGLNAILPPRYQDNTSVSAEPMGAADLIFDENGQVAWDEIWGDFCDLALAGGPPHRGTLLEPVSAEAARANPEGYRRVLAELERGLRMVTNLPVVASASPGWIGIQCTDEEMALWLLRAIIVENVSVRREGDVLYLPAGPDFRLECEIKNVITVIAKTHHYWTEHTAYS